VSAVLAALELQKLKKNIEKTKIVRDEGNSVQKEEFFSHIPCFILFYFFFAIQRYKDLFLSISIFCEITKGLCGHIDIIGESCSRMRNQRELHVIYPSINLLKCSEHSNCFHY